MKTLKPFVVFGVILLLAAGVYAQDSNVSFRTGVYPSPWCPIQGPLGPLADGWMVGVYLCGPNGIVDPPLAGGLPGGDDLRSSALMPNGTDHMILGYAEPPFVADGNLYTGNGAVIIRQVGTGVEPCWNQGEYGYLRAFNAASVDLATHYNDLMTVGGVANNRYTTTISGPLIVQVCFGQAIQIPSEVCLPQEEAGPETAVIPPHATHYFFDDECTLWITAGMEPLTVTAQLFNIQPPCPPFATMYMTRVFELSGPPPIPDSFFDVFFGYSQADYDASDFGADETMLHVAWYNGGVVGCTGQWDKALPTLVTDTPEGGYAQVSVDHFSLWSFGWDGGNTQLPVELTAFTAQAGDRMIVLNWATASETNNRGFYLERSTDGENFTRLPEMIEGSNSPTGSEYTYQDNNLVNSVHYTYRLVDQDINGNETVSELTAEATPSFLGEAVVVTEYKLHQNYPNPFNPATSLVYDVLETGFVTLKVYNVMGQEVKTLVSADRDNGRYAVTFDATGLSSGIYFYTVKVNNFSDTKKMLLVQ